MVDPVEEVIHLGRGSTLSEASRAALENHKLVDTLWLDLHKSCHKNLMLY